jgi:hypothetical protein
MLNLKVAQDQPQASFFQFFGKTTEEKIAILGRIGTSLNFSDVPLIMQARHTEKDPSVIQLLEDLLNKVVQD